MRITVVVPTYRRPETLRATVAALLLTDLRPEEYEVVVVDDGGDLDTAAVVASFGHGQCSVTYLANPGRGAASARNTGARAGTGEFLLFLDDDMRVRPQHLRQHLETHAAHAGAIIGGDRWYSPSSLCALEASPFGRYRIWLERGYAAGRGEVGGEGVVEVVTLPSFDMSIERRSFWELGGFDESFPYAGAEDQDLSSRATQAGLSLLRNRDIRLLHDDPTTTLRKFSQREERGAHTVAALVRKFPEYLGDFHKNGPIVRDDSLALVASKVAKSALSSDPVLRSFHAFAERLERRRAPDAVLWPVYRVIVGLHIFRGYRAALHGSGRGRLG